MYLQPACASEGVGWQQETSSEFGMGTCVKSKLTPEPKAIFPCR